VDLTQRGERRGGLKGGPKSWVPWNDALGRAWKLGVHAMERESSEPWRRLDL